MEGTKIFVGNAAHLEKEDLRDNFAKFGEIRDVWIARSPPGFGFVSYYKPEDAEKAINEGNGMEIRGDKLIVELARPPREHYRDRRSRSRSYSRRHRSRSYSRSRSYGHRHHYRSHSHSRSKRNHHHHSRSDSRDHRSSRRDRSRSASSRSPSRSVSASRSVSPVKEVVKQDAPAVAVNPV